VKNTFVHKKGAKMNVRNVRIVGLLGASCLVFALQGMKGDPVADEAKSHVEALFSCHPLFEFAMSEDDASFAGMLDEIHATFVNRIEFNTVEQNGAFIKELAESIATQKSESIALMKQQHFEESVISIFIQRISRLEKLMRAFVESCEIQKRGDLDTQLPIMNGLNPALLNPNRREPQRLERSNGNYFGSSFYTLLIGSLVVMAGYAVTAMRK
jgi:hypothetical protein